MKISGRAVGLLLLWVAVAAAITTEEERKIREGIQAGQDFTDALQTANGLSGFTDSLRKMNDVIGPWVDGIGVFSSVLDMFLPEENEMLNEMKRGFQEVNERLDEIKEAINEVKEIIKWADVKVNFMLIEQDIRTLDEKLKEVIQAPNPEHGKQEYIRVYEDRYNEAGLLLWDSIVNNDQLFYENILTAGVKYTDERRDQMADFMRGLIALLMKSSNIEVSYESFKEQDRGMTTIWKNRLHEAQQAFVECDSKLEESWMRRFRGEVDAIAQDMQGVHMTEFRDTVYNFLTDRYSWNKWFVLVYDPVIGGDKHGVAYLPDYCHVAFRSYGRNYIIGAAPGESWFDLAAAKKTAKRDIECPHSQSKCSEDSSYIVADLAYPHGVLRAAIRPDRSSWSMIATPGSAAWDRMYLMKGFSWERAHHQFQFG